jgi:ribonucleoside-diphosphate reductase beta chain
VDLFVKIFKEILQENPDLKTKELEDFVLGTFKRAAELEINWARYVIGEKTEGILLSDVEAYIKFYANVRCNQLGYERPFEGYRTNPLRWIVAYEEVDHGKSDFFEQKSRQYTKVQVDNGFDEL